MEKSSGQVGERTTMDEIQARIEQAKNILDSFLAKFSEYSEEVFGERRRDRLDNLRTQLQRQEPGVTSLVLEIIGNGTTGGIDHSAVLMSALLGGNNEMTHNFRRLGPFVTALLNKALGAVEAGLWPPKTPVPVLVIEDSELRRRCSDLLRAPGAYDRVIREATTILEDRIRNKPSHQRLARLVPNAADQVGENLVNKLFSPDSPVLVISDDKPRRVALHQVLLGVFKYLRNPYHHRIDTNTEWSWAWSTVGFIDGLLADIGVCRVEGERPAQE